MAQAAAPMAHFHPLLVFLAALAPPAHAAAPLPRHLRDTGLYAPGRRERRSPRTSSPFRPQYALWSDGADKRRWIRLPPGARIDARDPDRWAFPVGTRLWKEFSLGRRLETRMLERTRDRAGASAPTSGHEDGTDAVLAPADGVPRGRCGAGWRPLDHPGHRATARPATRASPTRSSASPPSSSRPTGTRARRTPRAAHAEVQLEDLLARGLLRGLPPSLAAAHRASPLPVRRAGGARLPARQLRHLSQPPWSARRHRPRPAPERLRGARVRRADPGLGARAVRALRPVGGAEVRVEPGKPEHSVLFRRMGARDPLDQMPPLGTEKPDREALALVERWIHSLADRRTP